MNEPIYFNSGTPEWSWLSNFSSHPVGSFPTLEHAYQAAKSTDPDEQEKIHWADSPQAAKKMGRIVVHLRPNWDQVKVDMMRRALKRKFEDIDLRRRLLATGDRPLIHYAPWGDTFWGVGKDHSGENVQGILLMELRSQLRETA